MYMAFIHIFTAVSFQYSPQTKRNGYMRAPSTPGMCLAVTVRPINIPLTLLSHLCCLARGNIIPGLALHCRSGCHGSHVSDEKTETEGD